MRIKIHYFSKHNTHTHSATPLLATLLQSQCSGVQQGGQLQAIFYCAQNKYKSVETKTFWNNIKIAKTGALGLCGWGWLWQGERVKVQAGVKG